MNMMIEKAAKAAYDNYFNGQIGCTEPSWADLPPDYKDRLFHSIKAAIETLREPTEEMEAEAKEMNKLLGMENLNAAMGCYNRILNAALKETK